MTVTAIVKRKRTTRYDIFLDGQYYATLSDDCILTHRIKVGMQVDMAQFVEMVQEGEKQDAVNYILGSLSTKAHTMHTATEKMQEHGFSSDAIRYALEKMQYYGYINDEQYCREYIEQMRLTRSNRRLRQDLWQRGVDEALIGQCLVGNDESEACYTSLCRKAKGKPFTADYIVKLTRYLMQQGYEYTVVKDCLKRYAQAQDDDR